MYEGMLTVSWPRAVFISADAVDVSASEKAIDNGDVPPFATLEATA